MYRMSLRDLEVGDKVVRLMGGLEMPGTVMFIEEDLIYVACEGTEGWSKESLWRFDRDTGCEEDEDLGWGKEYGVTGSYIRGL